MSIRTAIATTWQRIRTRATRLLAPTIVKRRNGAEITERLTDGRLTTITPALHRLGADLDFTGRYGSHAGKAVAKAYRTTHGCDPMRVWTISRSGYPIQVFAYLPTDNALTTGFRTYPRTRDLFAA